MEKQEITILQALENEEVFVSVRRNRLYKTENLTKANFKLVLAITAESTHGRTIASNIKKSVNTADLFLEEHEDEGITHLLVYCKNAQIINDIIEYSINGHTLRSNTRYEVITKEELKEKAHLFEAALAE